MEEIKNQLQIIKTRGLDMNDAQKVMNEAVDLGFFGLAIYIADHRNEYLQNLSMK